MIQQKVHKATELKQLNVSKKLIEQEIEQRKIEYVKLESFHCIKCGKLLGKLKLIQGEIIIEIKCYNCNFYNAIYLKKKELA